MKLYIGVFLAVICSGLYLTSCQKDDSTSKVSVAEGKINLKIIDTKEFYNIIDIKTTINGDSTSIVIEAVNEDSTEYLIFGFENIKDFGPKDYAITLPGQDTAGRVYAKLRMGSGNNFITYNYTAGLFSVLSYREKSDIQGKFEFVMPSSATDTVKTMSGEFYASYALLDPGRIPDVPINPQTMQVTIDKMPTMLNATGGLITKEGEKSYVINGTLGNDVAVTLSFNYFVPKINESYKIGQAIIIENDPSDPDDNDTGYVEASYFVKGVTYFADDKRGSGQFTVKKITSNTIQGIFNFNAVNIKDASQQAVLEDGIFYLKYKSSK